jgi:hypothetical protein
MFANVNGAQSTSYLVDLSTLGRDGHAAQFAPNDSKNTFVVLLANKKSEHGQQSLFLNLLVYHLYSRMYVSLGGAS